MASMAPARAAQNAPPFNDATRRKVSQLPTITRPSGGGTTRFDLPRVGLFGRLYCYITGTLGGTPTSQNVLGFSSMLRQLRVQTNLGTDLFNVTGPGYHFLLRPYLDAPFDPLPQTNGRTAISATSLDISVIVPIQINLRDPVGLFMLQNEQALCSVIADWELDANVASALLFTATGVPTLVPYIEWFTVPDDPASYPPLSMLHQIIEDRVGVAATGLLTYNWPRGNTYLQMLHGIGFGASGAADNFSRIQLRANFSDYLHDTDVNYFTTSNPLIRNQQRLTGTFNFDFLSSAGLGVYDQARDRIDSSLLTDLATLTNITALVAGTPSGVQSNFYALRRQFVPVL